MKKELITALFLRVIGSLIIFIEWTSLVHKLSVILLFW